MKHAACDNVAFQRAVIGALEMKGCLETSAKTRSSPAQNYFDRNGNRDAILLITDVAELSNSMKVDKTTNHHRQGQHDWPVVQSQEY